MSNASEPRDEQGLNGPAAPKHDAQVRRPDPESTRIVCHRVARRSHADGVHGPQISPCQRLVARTHIDEPRGRIDLDGDRAPAMDGVLARRRERAGQVGGRGTNGGPIRRRAKVGDREPEQ